ncbi:hypothetical protein EIP91_006217 [Steccherinum ochraceum]|uniref:Uncharacterized protein n=1 Tax=Steccherinum ochraceum TaxID=92696 RepID=A0A4R0REE3_9APHY|nr:hypothetical protein EIP91_006217 [Steccherinum ochraceum]
MQQIPLHTSLYFIDTSILVQQFTMSAIVAPDYVQTHTELLAVLSKAKKLPDDQVKQGLGLLAAQITDPTAQKHIGEEIQDLSIRAVTLARTFAAIDALIPKQDAETHEIDSLTNAWAALHEDYKQLLVKSSQVAGQAHEIATSFATKFMASLGDDSVSVANKAASMQSYKKLCDENSQNAHGLAGGFEKLQQDISAFLKIWPSWDAEDLGLKKMDADIETLQNTVVDLQNNVSHLQLTFTYGDVPSTTGVTSILGSMIPTFWTCALASAVGPLIDPALLVKIKSEAIALKPELSSKRALRAQTQAELTPQQRVQAYLIDVPTDLSGVVKPLGALTLIWDSIRSDLAVIEQTMTSSAGDPNVKQLLLPRLQAFSGLYKIAGGTFAGYKNIVDTSLHSSQ